jgi:hypothetical protein
MVFALSLFFNSFDTSAKNELSTKFNAHRNRNKFPIGTALTKLER